MGDKIDCAATIKGNPDQQATDRIHLCIVVFIGLMCTQQRIDRDEIDALLEEHAAQLVDGLAGLDAPAIRPKHRELELHWRGDEKTIQQFVHRDLVECLTLLGVRDPSEFAKFLAMAAPKQSYLAGRPHAEVLEPREAINPIPALAALVTIVAGGLMGFVAARLPRGLGAVLRWLSGIFAAVPALLLAVVFVGIAGREFCALAAGIAAAPLAFARAYDRARLMSQTRHVEFAHTTGIPARRRILRASALSPILRIASGDGPMNVMW